MFRRRLSLSELEEPLTLVLDHWRARGGEDLACSWKLFEIQKLPPQVLPTTLVIDTYDDMSKNRFRYWGSRMTDIHGEDMTGKCPYDMSPRDFAEDLREQHREIRDGRKATADVLGFNHERGFIQAHSILRLPLSNDGKTVSQIVGVIWFTDETLKKFAQENDVA